MMKHVVVICGGRSVEHEVSLVSAASILRHLDRRQYRISVLGVYKDGSLYDPARLRSRLKLSEGEWEGIHLPDGEDWPCLLRRLDPPVDVVFPVLHGPYGEDGTLQGTLEILDLPYVGAGVWGSAVGMNKIHCKRLLKEAGIAVLPFVAFHGREWSRRSGELVQEVEERLRYPLFVKPANLGSSVGINKSRNREELGRHIETALRFDEYVLVEEGIEAREIELSVLGNLDPVASVAGEIVPGAEFYTYEAKYLDRGSRLLIPAPLDETAMREVQATGLATYRTLQLEGMARIDFLLDRNSARLWVNEVNTIPGFTQISMYPKLWEASGLPYPRLLDRLIELGEERYRRRSRLSVERESHQPPSESATSRAE